MTTEVVFNIHLVLGYLAWGLLFGTYLLPRLKQMPQLEALRAVATLHSFRFFGLVFIVPGVIGQHLPTEFAAYAAYGDLATGVLALLALIAFRWRAIFVSLVVAFNVVGTFDLLIDYWHAVQADVPKIAGELGATYAIPIIYVPILMITHVWAFYLLAKGRQPKLVAA